MSNTFMNDSEKANCVNSRAVKGIIISSQPNDITVEVGSHINLFAQVIANNNPLFQWYNQHGQPIPNQTYDNLFLSPIKQEDFGYYKLLVLDPLTGEQVFTRWVEIIDYYAQLNNSRPKLLEGIVGKCSSYGNTVTLTAHFENATSYQWYKDGYRIHGCTGNSLVIYSPSLCSNGVYVLGATNPNSGVMETTAGTELVSN